MKKIQQASGTVCIRITCAEPLSLVQKLTNDHNFTLFDIQQIDSLTVTIRVLAKEYRKICSLLDRCSFRYEAFDKEGTYWFLRMAPQRGVLIVGIFMLLFVTLFIPTRIYFVNIDGNESIPSQYILECAQDCGIVFGASRRQVRSEKMKNALLDAIPELQWAGINTSGCVATIQVREKNISSENQNVNGISNIVAERDGIIYSCTVEAGNVLCRVGQAVSKGQVLVSGYRDSGLLVTGQNVKADIYALTQRSIEMVSPCLYKKRIVQSNETVRYSIRIGKNIIKLWKDSGIYDSTCVKMYSEEYMCLPGGFRLPVALITERIVQCDISDVQESDADSFTWMGDCSGDYVLGQMVAGQILHADTSAQIMNEVCVLNGQFACVEMIGKYKTEEISNNYGENE